MEQMVAFESDCISIFTGLLQKNNPERALLVTGKSSFEKSGAKDFIMECLKDNQIEITRFSHFANNPNIQDLKKALEITKELNPNLIIAIGGGSVLDMGKLIRFFHTHDGEILRGHYKSCNRNIPLVAIPTTAGTGSEATHFAVLYDEAKTKHSVACPNILPDYALVNSILTHGQSSYLTACAGFDALAQGIEAYWNKNSTEESDRYSENAINLILNTLPEVVANPNEELRAKMSEGAYWAGKAINITKTTAPHAFSYPLTTHYGYAHGHAVALTFPYIAEYNLKNGQISGSKKLKIMNLFGIKTDNDILTVIRRYVNQLRLMPKEIDHDINILVKEINLERLMNNPIPISKDDALLIYNNAVNGRSIH